MGNRAAHPHQEFLGVPPGSKITRQEGGIAASNVCLQALILSLPLLAIFSPFPQTRLPNLTIRQKLLSYRVFSLTWPASMLIYWNKRKRLHKKRVQLPEDWFGTPTWPPFHCCGTPIWPPRRHVKTLYTKRRLARADMKNAHVKHTFLFKVYFNILSYRLSSQRPVELPVVH